MDSSLWRFEDLVLWYPIGSIEISNTMGGESLQLDTSLGQSGLNLIVKAQLGSCPMP